MIDTLLAMDPLVLASFVGAGIALNLTPGADVMFAMASGAQGGWRAGLAAAAGVSAGGLVHAVLAAIGLSALIGAIPGALEGIRWAGAAYLAWLAVHTIRHAGTPVRADGARALRRAFARGLLTNLLNPKVILFILAFLPQFADPRIGPVWQQMLALGVVFALTGLVITGAYGALAGAFGTALSARKRVLDRLAGAVFAGLALRLVWT